MSKIENEMRILLKRTLPILALAGESDLGADICAVLNKSYCESGLDRVKIGGKVYVARDCSELSCSDCALLSLDVDCGDYPCCNYEREDGREIVWVEEK